MKKTQWEGSYLLNRKQALTRYQICQCLDLVVLSLQSCEKWMSVVLLFKSPSLWYFCCSISKGIRWIVTCILFLGFCYVHVCVCSVTQSCPTLCEPMYCSLPGSSTHGTFQAEHWNRLPFPTPEDRPNPGIDPGSLVSPAGSLPLMPPGKPLHVHILHKNLSTLWDLFWCIRRNGRRLTLTDFPYIVYVLIFSFSIGL